MYYRILEKRYYNGVEFSARETIKYRFTDAMQWFNIICERVDQLNAKHGAIFESVYLQRINVPHGCNFKDDDIKYIASHEYTKEQENKTNE